MYEKFFLYRDTIKAFQVTKILIFNLARAAIRYRLGKTTRNAVRLHDNEWSRLRVAEDGWIVGTLVLPFFDRGAGIFPRRLHCHFVIHCAFGRMRGIFFYPNSCTLFAFDSRNHEFRHSIPSHFVRARI